MMREIVMNRDSTFDTAQFQSTLDAMERRQRRESMRHRNAHMPRCGERRQGIQLTVPADLSERQRSLRRAAQQDRAVNGDGPIRAGAAHLRKAKAFDLAPATSRRKRAQR